MFSFITPTLLWLIIGIFLIIAEVFLPGAVVGIIGFSALIISAISWSGLVNNFYIQIIIFIILSICFIFLFFKFLKKNLKGRDSGTTNDYIEIGKIVPVSESINSSAGRGRVRYMGSQWNAVADIDIEKGDSVRVIGCDNLTLEVEKIEDVELSN